MPPTPRNGLGAGRAGQREDQAGIEQGRGLAGARRADDDVPGQLIEKVAPRFVRFAQRLDRVGHAFGELLGVGVRFREIVFRELAGDRRRGLPPLVETPGMVTEEQGQDQNDQRHTQPDTGNGRTSPMATSGNTSQISTLKVPGWR